MNFPLPDVTVRAHASAPEEDSSHARQIRSLLSLFVLYAAALVAVIVLPDGADIGCILAGIAGHVLYAGSKLALEWRDASCLAGARLRVYRRRFA